MKFSYTHEEIEAWRDKVHRRTSRLAVKTRKAALGFVNTVGFCFAFKSEHSESPCMWHAAVGQRTPIMPRHTHNDPYLSFVWEMKNILPAEKKIYYGKLLKNRPTMVSLDYFPYFYALSRRNGSDDEYLEEFAEGNLSVAAKSIMDALSDSSPQVTKGLKLASGLHSKADRKEFDKGIAELQRKMFIVKVAEHYDPFTFEWDVVARRFPKETRHSRKITEEQAREKILHRYFQNQLVATVTSIQRLFGWQKQDIFRALGHLKNKGMITPNVFVDGGDNKYYGLIH
ncbi:MAG: hypothetical protein HW412_210 [Bacteroidetes bacterium]|nr:hypothetical protein [Bacteroidota bacterium]